MRKREYFVSLMLALLLVSGLAMWTQATQQGSSTALSCRPGYSSAAGVLKGMSLYPRCAGSSRRVAPVHIHSPWPELPKT